MFKKKKRDKFNTDKSEKGKAKRTFEGVVFASELELKYYRDYLLPLKEQGIIKNIILQPERLLIPKYRKDGKNVLALKYVLDFEVENADGSKYLVDTKGLPTESAKIKLKLFNYFYPNEKLLWVGWSAKDGWVEYSELLKLRAKRRREGKQ